MQDHERNHAACRECHGTYMFPSAMNPRLCALCEGAYELQHEWGRLD